MTDKQREKARERINSLKQLTKVCFSDMVKVERNRFRTWKMKHLLITIHSHPNSYPPSVVDFNSNYSHGYAMGVIICHDGKIFVYIANEEVDEELYAAYVKKYRLEGKSEFEAQWNALESISENTDIVFKEVGAYE
jgi:hypothetical protein